MWGRGQFRSILIFVDHFSLRLELISELFEFKTFKTSRDRLQPMKEAGRDVFLFQGCSSRD